MWLRINGGLQRKSWILMVSLKKPFILTKWSFYVIEKETNGTFPKKCKKIDMTNFQTKIVF